MSGAETGPGGPTYPVGVIAKLFDLTERQIQSLAKQGVLPKTDHGRYELVPVVRAYIKYLRDRSIRGDVANSEVLAAKQRLLRARARAAEIEADQLEGASLNRAAVDRAWSTVLDVIRTRMLAIPSAASGPGFAAASQLELNSIITQAVHDALEDAARTPVYEAPGSTARANPDDPGDFEDVDAADEVDGEPVG